MSGPCWRTIFSGAALLALAVAPRAALGAAPPAASFELERLHGRYEGLMTELRPIEQAGMTIQVSSPRHALTLDGNRVELAPAGDGSHRARVSLDFEGDGDLVLDVGVAGITNRLEDKVVLPRQQHVVEGRVKIERVEGGFRVTTVELPATFEVEVDSRLAGQLATVCDQLALLAVSSAGCAGLRASLSHVALPMPAPGQSFLLADDQLTPAERQGLGRYLASTAPRP